MGKVRKAIDSVHIDVVYVLIASYSLSLVDAIDTLATLGNSTEFARVYVLIQNLDIERDINVSVFETNIRGKASAPIPANRSSTAAETGCWMRSPLLIITICLLVIGGLLSAHLLAKRMNVPVNATWPCTGPLLDLAVALADKILPGRSTGTSIVLTLMHVFTRRLRLF